MFANAAVRNADGFSSTRQRTTNGAGAPWTGAGTAQKRAVTTRARTRSVAAAIKYTGIS